MCCAEGVEMATVRRSSTSSNTGPTGVQGATHSTSPRSGARHKTFVLDTSVLLSDPRAILRFREHEVVLPTTGSTTSCSRKRSIARGSDSRTEVSSTNVLCLAPDRGEVLCVAPWTPVGPVLELVEERRTVAISTPSAQHIRLYLYSRTRCRDRSTVRR